MENTVHQWIASIFSHPLIGKQEYEETWEQFVDDIAEAGKWLADIVGDKSFDNWYERLDSLTTWYMLSTERDERDCRRAFSLVIEDEEWADESPVAC